MGEVLGAVCFVSSLLLSALWASHVDLKEKRLEAEKEAELERKEAEKQEALAQKEAEKQAKLEEKEREREQKELERQARQAATKRGDSAMDRFTKNIMSSVGREVGRVITRGVMGLFKK